MADSDNACDPQSKNAFSTLVTMFNTVLEQFVGIVPVATYQATYDGSCDFSFSGVCLVAATDMLQQLDRGCSQLTEVQCQDRVNSSQTSTSPSFQSLPKHREQRRLRLDYSSSASPTPSKLRLYHPIAWVPLRAMLLSLQ